MLKIVICLTVVNIVNQFESASSGIYLSGREIQNGGYFRIFLNLCLELNPGGYKELLRMNYPFGWVSDQKARVVNDMLITVTDNLNGFTDTIKSFFPQSTTQICVVHQIRNSCRCVVWKEKKAFTQMNWKNRQDNSFITHFFDNSNSAIYLLYLVGTDI